ncbi:ATP-binding protein, partial [Pseudomonas aeruginosa]|nr:ATP-binding protein [Pseudomonas aeruginosa]
FCIFFVKNVAPSNSMSYDLAHFLNNALSTVLGVAFAVLVFNLVSLRPGERHYRRMLQATLGDLGAEVDSLLEFYQPLAEDHDIRLLREGSLSLPGDRGMLRRVLANLLDNALRFTADGGEIRIRLGDRRLSVENQGPAIPPERLPRLFDRFYRADPARREGQGEHAGLGLAICRSIVQAHGGEIRCESADGWTRFVIDFARPRR